MIFCQMWNFRVFVLLFFVLSISPIVSAQAQPKPLRITIAGAPAGAPFYSLAGGMASILSKNIPGMEASAESTNGSIDNCKLVHMRKTELGLTQNDIAYSALKGTERFKSMGPLQLRTVAVLFPWYLHFVTLQGSGINSVIDLRSRRVAVGSPGAGVETMTRSVLESYGIDMEKEVKKENLHGFQATDALKDRKIDALTWSTGLGAAGLLDLAGTPGIKMKLLRNDEHFDALKRKHGPIYSKGIIPRNAYPHLDTDVKVLTVLSILICHEQMEADLVYQVLKALVDYRQELIMVFKGASDFTLEKAALDSALPLHPGAIRYFKEKGIRMQ